MQPFSLAWNKNTKGNAINNTGNTAESEKHSDPGIQDP
jgi:hypothetical protein